MTRTRDTYSRSIPFFHDLYDQQLALDVYARRVRGNHARRPAVLAEKILSGCSGTLLLENHLHLIAVVPRLSNIMQSFKSFTTQEITDLLKGCGASTLLRQMSSLKLRHKTESEYPVWQEGSKRLRIRNDATMRQKKDFIQMNSVKQGDAHDPIHGCCSIARNHAGQPGLIEVITDGG